jgi:hypothetical protein
MFFFIVVIGSPGIFFECVRFYGCCVCSARWCFGTKISTRVTRKVRNKQKTRSTLPSFAKTRKIHVKEQTVGHVVKRKISQLSSSSLPRSKTCCLFYVVGSTLHQKQSKPKRYLPFKKYSVFENPWCESIMTHPTGMSAEESRHDSQDSFNKEFVNEKRYLFYTVGRKEFHVNLIFGVVVVTKFSTLPKSIRIDSIEVLLLDSTIYICMVYYEEFSIQTTIL